MQQEIQKMSKYVCVLHYCCHFFFCIFAIFLLFSVLYRKISEQNAYISKLEMTVQNQRYVSMIYEKRSGPKNSIHTLWKPQRIRAGAHQFMWKLLYVSSAISMFHSSWQNCLISFSLHRDHEWTAFVKLTHKFSVKFSITFHRVRIILNYSKYVLMY